jgi:homoserine kinase type II
MNEIEQVKDEIFECIERYFDVKILADQLIPLGWLNYKWKIETDRCILFVKQYHPQRYPEQKLARIREALRLQSYLHHQGVLARNLGCGKNLPHSNTG